MLPACLGDYIDNKYVVIVTSINGSFFIRFTSICPVTTFNMDLTNSQLCILIMRYIYAFIHLIVQSSNITKLAIIAITY